MGAAIQEWEQEFFVYQDRTPLQKNRRKKNNRNLRKKELDFIWGNGFVLQQEEMFKSPLTLEVKETLDPRKSPNPPNKNSNIEDTIVLGVDYLSMLRKKGVHPFGDHKDDMDIRMLDLNPQRDNIDGMRINTMRPIQSRSLSTPKHLQSMPPCLMEK